MAPNNGNDTPSSDTDDGQPQSDVSDAAGADADVSGTSTVFHDSNIGAVGGGGSILVSTNTQSQTDTPDAIPGTSSAVHDSNIGAVGGSVFAGIDYPFQTNPFMGNDANASTSMTHNRATDYSDIGAVGVSIFAGNDEPFQANPFMGSDANASTSMTYGFSTNDNNVGASFDKLLDAAVANFLVDPWCNVPEQNDSSTELAPMVKGEPGTISCYLQFNFHRIFSHFI